MDETILGTHHNPADGGHHRRNRSLCAHTHPCNRTSSHHYDTIRIIETPDKRHFRARNIELNRADTTALKSIYGIGSVFARRIVEYRDQLGGYAKIDQLTEVKGITEEIYERIKPNIWVDTLGIQKIKVNFATRKQLEKHPYFTPSMVGRVLKAVEMKGGYATLRQLLNDNILLP